MSPKQRYLYHDVHVLAVLQQTQVGVQVEPVVPGVGVGQDHFALPQRLEEELPPERSLLCQQLPLKQTEVTESTLLPDGEHLTLTQTATAAAPAELQTCEPLSPVPFSSSCP